VRNQPDGKGENQREHDATITYVVAILWRAKYAAGS